MKMAAGEKSDDDYRSEVKGILERARRALARAEKRHWFWWLVMGLFVAIPAAVLEFLARKLPEMGEMDERLQLGWIVVSVASVIFNNRKQLFDPRAKIKHEEDRDEVRVLIRDLEAAPPNGPLTAWIKRLVDQDAKVIIERLREH